MWKLLIIGILPVLASTDSFVDVPEDELINSYKTARALLTPEQEEFLMELLAADDALIEATSRGIVDDILQALSGTGGNIRVNIVGGSSSQQQPQQAAPAAAAANNQGQQPTVNIINPSFMLVNTPTNQEKTLINSNNSTNQGNKPYTGSMPMSDLSSPAAPSSSQGTASVVGVGPFQRPSTSANTNNNGPSSIVVGTLGNNQAPRQQQMQVGNVTTIGGSNNHLFQTISSVIRNSNTRNVTGIVDESLRIATPAPIREFVTGILNVVYCNGIRRLLGRC